MTTAAAAVAPHAPPSLIDRVRAHLTAAVAHWPLLAPSERVPKVHELLTLPRRGSRESAPDPLVGLEPPVLAVLCSADRAAPNMVRDPDRGGVVQRVTASVAIYVGVPARNDLHGRRGTTDAALDTYVSRARAALLGWAPDGPFDPAPRGAGAAERGGRWTPLELRAGRLFDLRDAVAWWEDTWETSRLMRGAAPPEAPGVVPSTVHSELHDQDLSHDRGRLTGLDTC